MSLLAHIIGADAPDDERPALILDDRIISWREFQEVVEHQRQLLSDVMEGDLVCVRGESWLWVPTLLAVWSKQGCFMPQSDDIVDPRAPNARVTIRLSPTDVREGCLSWSERPSSKFPDTAYLFPTSGSSGERKWVRGSASGLSNFIDWECSHLGVSPDDIFSQLTPPTFDPVLRDVLVPLSAGASIAIPRDRQLLARDGVGAVRWLAERSVTILHAVPTLARLWCTSDSGVELPKLRALILAGEPLFARDVKSWRHRYGLGARILNLYGPTETTLAKCFQDIDGLDGVQDHEPLPVGRALPGSGVLVMSQGRVCSPYEVGEVLIRTPFGSHGYWPEDHPDNQYFTTNPLDASDSVTVFRSRDLGYLLPDGRLVVEGRMDDEFKFRGVRVNLRALEDRIRAVPGVQDAAVKVINPLSGPSIIAAYVVADIAVHAARDLVEFGEGPIPAAWISLDVIPKTTSGKLDRRLLPDPGGAVQTVVDVEDPRVRQVLDFFQAVFPLQADIRPTSGFSDFGGQSIEAIQLLTLLAERVNVHLDISDLMDLQSPQRIAALLGREPSSVDNQSAPASTDLRKRPLPTWVPLTAAQERFWTWMTLQDEPGRFQFLLALELVGAVDAERLRAAIAQVVGKAAPQWVRFRHEGDGPKQARTAGQLRVDIVDLTGRLEALAHARADSLRFRQEPMNLATGPLMRARIYLVEDERLVLAVVNHVLASDGWTKTRLLSQVRDAYNLGSLPVVEGDRFFKYATDEYARRSGWGQGDPFWAPRWECVQQMALGRDGQTAADSKLHMSRTVSFRLGTRFAAFERARVTHSVSSAAILICALTAALQEWTGETSVNFLLSNARRNEPSLNDVLGCFTDSTLFTHGTEVRPDWYSVRLIADSVNEHLSQDHQGFLWAAQRYRPDLDPFSPHDFPIIFAPQNDYAAALKISDQTKELNWSHGSWIWPVEVYPVITESDVVVDINYAIEHFDEVDMQQVAARMERFLTDLIGVV